MYFISRFANRRCSRTQPRMHGNASSGGPGTLLDDKTTAGPREQPSGGPRISSDLLDDHHTDGDEKWNKPLVQTSTTLPEIEKNTEGG